MGRNWTARKSDGSVFLLLGSKTWRRGESARLPPMWPRVQIPASMSYLGRACCWFSPLLWEVFLCSPFFSLSSKTNISKCQSDEESGRRRTTLWMCYLQIIIYFILPCFCKEITPVLSDSPTVIVTELRRITYFALIIQLLLRGLIPIRRTCHPSCGNQLCSLACGLLCGCLIWKRTTINITSLHLFQWNSS